MTHVKGEIRDVIQTLFRVYDKDSQLVDFILNPTQCIIDETLDDDVHFLKVLKARQKGCSTYIMARFLVECMSEHHIVVMLAHDRDHTEKLLRRSQELLANIKGRKPLTERMNANEIYFKKTQSSFYIGTAGSTNFGRSSTITRLHMSEFAFWPEPKKLLTGLLQAVPYSGVIVEETTANGWGTYHQKQFYSAMAHPSKRFFPLFIPWNIDEEYVSYTPLSSPLTEREVELRDKFDLSVHQLQWRREKLEQLENDEPEFMQEYPLCVEDAFLVSGASLFGMLKQTVPEDGVWEASRNVGRLSGHPKKGYSYVAGADSSGGTGNDYSTIVVLCVETLEQVYEYADNTISPPAFGELLAEVGKEFNEALLVPESNSHGLSVLAVLRRLYPLLRIYRHQTSTKQPQQAIQVPSYSYGWRTGALSKPYMVGMAIKIIEEGVKVYSPALYDELKSFSEDPKTGKLAGAGEHDDIAIAFMLACMGLIKANIYFPNVSNIFEKKEAVVAQESNVVDISTGREVSTKSWRDEDGRYLVSYEDCFPKTKNNVHLISLGRR